MEIYDVIIIGAGPAGLTAAVYAGRYLLNTIVIGVTPGGTMTEAHKVCNFPSYKSISGIELMQKIIEQVRDLGIDIKQEEVKEIKIQENQKFSGLQKSKTIFAENKIFEVKTNNSTYKTKKIILAIGRKKEKLNVKGEEKFLGKGVSYCTICDASFFKNKIVAVIGGSNAALTSALLLAENAKKVYLIYRKGKFFRAEPFWIKQVEKNKKIKTMFNSNVKEIYGDEKVKGVKLNNEKDIEVSGIFIEIGSIPNKEFPKQLNLETEESYIKINKKQETSIKGIYAAGDITNNSLKQMITACGEGAIAATSAYEEIKLRKDVKGGKRND